MIRKVAFFGLSLVTLAVLGDETEFRLLENEYWWGGHSFKGRSMPYSAEKPFSDTLIDNNQCNQTSGMLISSAWVSSK